MLTSMSPVNLYTTDKTNDYENDHFQFWSIRYVPGVLGPGVKRMNTTVILSD